VRKCGRGRLEIAESWIGTPYRHQASRRQVGCDCLGLMLGIWRELYGERWQCGLLFAGLGGDFACGEPLLDELRERCDELEPDEMRPGDILAFRWQAGSAAKHLALLAPGKPHHPCL
jgi:NlpC/P60 family putative phage cell wall peptidase